MVTATTRLCAPIGPLLLNISAVVLTRFDGIILKVPTVALLLGVWLSWAGWFAKA